MADLYRFPGVQRDTSQQSIEQQLQLAYERGLTDGKRLGAEEGKQQAQQLAQQQAQAGAEEQLKQAVRALRQQFEQQLTQLQQQLAGQGVAVAAVQIRARLFAVFEHLALGVAGFEGQGDNGVGSNDHARSHAVGLWRWALLGRKALHTPSSVTR